ncbi:DNA-binding MurR/RpiR family transcriptional regulator [Inquilinus ginsengisoli]|uniref:DNA-binding MurR/RpiR family transcriptional regulator n=1 Tax=Inquilinus ginsengisoli TaxID=363840 RepID=A0ABU1JWI5_9PROT|nr:MurR/RpiR family transcriptional regulator [Inquilinus ginsengisoli]MDR6292968.1 DNA-binding MurR/RpiR family transcriptional regulator [Inquilinus ginsengisoli]
MTATARPTPSSFDELVDTALPGLTPAEQRMARFFVEQKEAVLLASAAQIAAEAGTSDATVVRTARSLGFESLSHLRETLLSHLTGSTPGGRLRRTLEETGDDAGAALRHVLTTHREALEVLAAPEVQECFGRVVDALFSARRRYVFGIGPSGSLAEYAALQFNRIGLATGVLSATGIGLADQLLDVGAGDAILMIAYAPIYREVAVTLDVADQGRVPVLLVSDSLGPFVHGRVAEVLPVPRGRAGHLSMHAGTLVLIEAMIIALAARDRDAALASLEMLGAQRGKIDKLWLKRGAKKTP